MNITWPFEILQCQNIGLPLGHITYTNNHGVYFSLFTESSNDNTDTQLWHARLGHIGQDRMNRLARYGPLDQT